jgi:hypothetical protein
MVRAAETLFSVLVAPVDLKNDQIAITVITHAERKGMSVLRQSATDNEFRKILATRIKDAARRFHGVVPVSCADIRGLAATENGDQRRRGDRFYCVIDTDMDGLPNHADIFATVPRPHETKDAKVAWRKEREKLLALMLRDFSSPPEFRGGVLSGPAGGGS